MPGPVSVTETWTSPLSCDARTSTAPPAGENFTAFESRLKITWLILRSSPVTTSAPSDRGEGHLDAVLEGTFAHHHDASLERVVQRERRDLELDLSRLDLRQVEDVVDEREQVVPGREDVLEILLLLLVDLAEHPFAQHLGEADDRVQRRAELVRHVGEELGLVLAGGLELLVETLELVVHPVDVGGRARRARPGS